MATALDRPPDVDLEPWVRRLGWATLVANVVIIVTGGAVRLTGSGLGCPTWPRCTSDSLIPHGASSVHQLVEFGNRTLTFVLVVVAVATVVATFRSSRRDLRLHSVLLALGIPLQAVIGGVSVLTDLNPWVVSLHLLLSMALVGFSVLFLWRERGAGLLRRGPAPRLAQATFGAAWLVLYLGTVVTGAGPHAGDEKSPRNGLSTLEVSRVHSGLVWLLVALTVALLVALRSVENPGAVVAARALLAVELAQGVIGYVQYALNVPVPLVMLHVLGAALTSAAVTWTLLATRRVSVSGRGTPLDADLGG